MNARLAIVLAMLLLACSEQGKTPLPDGAKALGIAPVFSYALLPDGGALIYSDGADLVLRDLATGREVCLTGLDPDAKRKGEPGEKERQPGAELFPAVSPDGRFIAFAAWRRNDNADRTDDKDCDIWLLAFDDALRAGLADPKNLKPVEGSTRQLYVGQLELVQATNVKAVDETMPAWDPLFPRLYAVGAGKALLSFDVSRLVR